jgi:dTDP-4-amino-4,6-dideoxygalactose transaminase
VDRILFNQVHLAGDEFKYIEQALADGHLSGDGPFTLKVQALLREKTGTPQALLVHSCTAALEMAALLSDIKPGDEVLMPSYTFVSTANAFVLRGAVPVFVDVHPDTLNIDETLIEAAITGRTKAIIPVHYAGVGCAMDEILEIAKRHDLMVIEDAAQGMDASYKGRPLGTIGDFGALSFHATKNIVSGEGGALFVNNAHHRLHAEILREKGTNRSAHLRGEVDKYTWQEVGSSYLPSELNAAMLLAQLEGAKDVVTRRRKIWQNYHAAFQELAGAGRCRLPNVPGDRIHNAHIYFMIFANLAERERVRLALLNEGVVAYSHYQPLHSAPAGRKYCRVHGELPVTDHAAEGILRLPVYPDLAESDQARIIDAVLKHT